MYTVSYQLTNTGGLVVHIFYIKVQLISLPFITVVLSNLPYLNGEFSIFHGSSLVRTCFGTSTSFLNKLLRLYICFYKLCYNECLLFFCLFSFIYHMF